MSLIAGTLRTRFRERALARRYSWVPKHWIPDDTWDIKNWRPTPRQPLELFPQVVSSWANTFGKSEEAK